MNLKDKERLDDLQRNGYRIIQNPDVFCFGMDAVLLSGFARAKKGDRCLDLGCGNGIIPILMEAKTSGESFVGLELQDQVADMARRSVQLNNLDEKIEIVTGDIKEADKLFKAASFDVITTNPPYMIAEHGIVNPQSPKAIARHEIYCTLEDIINKSASLLKPGGHFYMVHRPFRLAQIISLMTLAKIEPKRMRLIHPYVDKEPNMVLIEGVRGGKMRMTVEPPMIIFDAPDEYTEDVKREYGF